MRVLVLNHTAVMSGGERSLLDLLDGLPEGITAVVACPPGPLADAVSERGVRWLPIPGTEASLRLHPVWTTRALLELGRSRRRVREALGRERFDVVHANSLRAGLLCAGVTDAPRVVFVRDVLPHRLIARLAASAVVRGNVRVLANSAYTAERFEQQAWRGAALEVVHSPVDAQRFDPARTTVEEARRRLGLPQDRFVAGIVGQITPWKGHDTVVRAIAHLARQGDDVMLAVAGSPRFAAPTTRFDNPSYLQDLHRLVDAAGVRDRVRFLGEREDVEVVMRSLDVLVVPSWSEPFGRVVVESLTMGTRVLATSQGGPREILRDGDGELVPWGDYGRWADALRGEYTRERDAPELVQRRRERAIERFGAEQHVRAVARVWDGLATRTPSA